MLVGRQRELDVLRLHLAEGGSVALVGDAGVGKTALLRAAGEASGRPVFEGGGLAGLPSLPYLALERALREAVGGEDPAAVASFVAERVGAGLLLLDDLQWMASETLALLPALTKRASVAVTIQHGDAGTPAALAAVATAELPIVPLEPLAEADACAVVVALRPHLDEDAVSRVVRAARGNPLLLHELSADGDPSSTLILSLRARLARASEEAIEAIALLALLGRPAKAGFLPKAPVEELRAVGLVVDDGTLVSLRHPLLGEVGVAAVTDDCRRDLHARLAAAVEDAGEAARHYRDAGQLKAARERALAAAAAAVGPEERAAQLGMAASVSRDGADADELRLRAAEALLEAGAFGAAEEVAASVASSDRLTRAEALLHRGRACWSLGRSDDACAAWEQGWRLARGSRTPTEVRLRLARCRPMLTTGQVRRGLPEARRTTRLADDLGVCRAEAHLDLAAFLYWSGAAEVLDETRIARDAAVYEGNHAVELRSLHLAAGWHESRLDAKAARRLLRRSVARARTLGLRSWELQSQWLLAHVTYHAVGRYPETIELLRMASNEPEFGHTDPDQIVADLAVTLADTGETTEARALLDERAGHGRDDWGRGVLLHARAELEWLQHRPAATIDTVDTYGRTIEEPNLAPQMSALRDYALWDLGRPPGPAPDRSSIPFVDLWRQECRAISVRHRPAEAERRFVELASLWHGNGVRYEVRCLWAAGEVARLAGAAERGRSHFLRAERIAVAQGLLPLLGRIRRSLRAVGVRRAAVRSAGGEGLTLREREVLSLVGEGQTSREIAGHLAVSSHTVDSIVRSSMTKLGASTRRRAAMLAAQDGS